VALGEADRARALTEEGLEVAQRTGDRMTEAYASINVGSVLAWEGELDAAQRAIEEGVRGARQVGNARSVANWLRVLGGIRLARGDNVQARLLFEESLAIHRTLGDPWGISHSLVRLALVMLEAHDVDASRRLLAESLAIGRETGERLGLAANLEAYARLAAVEGRPARAARLSAGASTLRESVGVDPCEPGWPDPEPIVADLRSALGEEAFARAWEEGRTMTLDESLDYALREEADPEPA
jgi:hypothetical protein